MRWRVRNGEWFQSGELADGRITTVTTMDQAERAVILERAARLRAEPGAVNDLSFGRLVASIPLEDYYEALQKYPELNSGDQVERTRAWARFLASEEAAKFKVTDAAAGRF